MNSEQLILILVSAISNGVFAAIAFYIGLTKGTSKTTDIMLNKLEERAKESPTAQRIMKSLEMLDKLFGDEQAVEQITEFFKEARTFVKSPELKNFFNNVIDLMKQLSGEGENKPLLTKPEKPA